MALSEIIASLHNADGSVNVPGFYDRVSKIETWGNQQKSLKIMKNIEYYENHYQRAV